MATGQLPQVVQFADAFFARHLPERHIPGAAFVAVRHGRIEALTGYGLAVLEPPTPVDPATTVFRLGSLSKLITAIAALQLIGEGRLDLDADVNRYLTAFQVPTTFPEPITARHLLTHTEGFEARMFGIYAPSPDRILPLREFLRKSLPDRFSAPAQLVSYGNFASALLGAVVEELTGERFAAYVAREVLGRVGMTGSSFEQPLPAELAERRAGEYFYDKGDYRALRGSWPHMVPAGAMCGTIEDLGRLLADLTSDDGELLDPQIRQAMVDTHFRVADGLPGVTLGLFEILENDHRLLVRDGETEAFIARVVIDPEAKAAFAYAINARDKPLSDILTSAYLDASYPASQPPAATPANLPPPSDYAGTYRFVQYTRHEFTKLVTLFTDVDVRAVDGRLVIEPRGEEPFCGIDERVTLEPLGPGLYRGDERAILVAFRRANGTTYLASGSGYHGVRYRIRPWETRSLHLGLLIGLSGLSLVVGVLSILFGGVQGWLAAVDNALVAASLLGFAPATMLVGLEPGVPAFVKGWTPVMRAYFFLAPLIAAVSIVLTLAAASEGGPAPIAWATLLIAAADLAFLRFWNLHRPGRLARI